MTVRPDAGAVAARALEAIQAEIGTAASRLETLTGELALASLMAQLESHFPADAAELERMGTDEVCPAVAFEVHGDLAFAIEALKEALTGLSRAADRTTETVQAAWQARRAAATEALEETLAGLRRDAGWNTKLVQAWQTRRLLARVDESAVRSGAPRARRDVVVIQASVLELAAKTARLRADCLDLVAELNRDHLPRGAEYDRMAEDGVAPSVAYHLAGVLGVVESDELRKVENDLRKVENDLLEASEATADSLATEFAPERRRPE